MEEKYISFETSKLAREKGFDELCWAYYNNGKFEHQITKCKNSTCCLPVAPTQSLLQRWLRERHDLHVHVNPFLNEVKGVNKLMYEKCISQKEDGYMGGFKNSADRLGSKNPFLYLYPSYEEALEIGLQEALNLIK